MEQKKMNLEVDEIREKMDQYNEVIESVLQGIDKRDEIILNLERKLRQYESPA